MEKLKNCRACDSSNLVDVLNLGKIYPSGFIRMDDNPLDKDKMPLVLCQCKSCGLIQLRHCIDLDLMYRQYWYSSSLNKSMVSSLENIVRDVESRIDLKDEDTVVDIGCNDGTMLGLYNNKMLYKVGYDPARNLNKPTGVYFVNDYFTSSGYFDILGHTKAKVVTAIAMFYDLPNPIKFCKEVASILDKDGLFVIQLTDLVSMFGVTAFDNICHEHYEYYRLQDIVNILQSAGLRVIDVSYNYVNGGSLRVIASHENSSYISSHRVTESLVDEFNFLQSFTFDKFKDNIEKTKFKVKSFLKWCESHKYPVFLLGASTKGNTLLQVCNVDNKLIPYAAEVNQDKFGLKTIGTNIEIISQDDALIKHPKFFFVPVWHFKHNILSNAKIIDYLKSGGTLVFPLPDFSVVNINGEWRI